MSSNPDPEDGRRLSLDEDSKPPPIPERASTPRALARTPTPISPLSDGKQTPVEDGRKTPSDMGGRTTPSTPLTPGSGVPHITSHDSIRRKPVPAPSYDTLRDIAALHDSGRASTPKNPLEKMTFTILPEQLAEKAPSTPDSTPRTHITLPGRGATAAKLEWLKIAELWWVEAAWCGVSLLCLIVIFAVLAAYNNQPLHTLPLNLNALLAFFTTVATVSFLVPLAESISQWKWNYFRSDDRSLSDFQLFDSATRNPVGSGLLFVKLRHTHVASVGALLCLLALITSAVTQVAVGHREVLIPLAGSGAVVAAARVLPEGQTSGFEGAVVSGLSAGDVIGFELPAVCPSAECTFPTISSLAVAASVRDITDRLTVQSGRSGGSRSNSTSEFRKSVVKSTYSASLPKDANCVLDTNFSFNVLACKTLGSRTISFGEDDLDRAAVYSMPIIYSSVKGSGNSTEVGFEAVEILFHLRVNNYNIEVSDGQRKVKLAATPGVTVADSADRGVEVECTMPTANSTRTAMECESSDNIPSDAFLSLQTAKGKSEKREAKDLFRAHFAALEEMALAINKGTSGLWMRDDDQKPEDATIVGAPQVSILGDAVYEGDPAKRIERLTQLAENIATSLTNSINSREQPTMGSPSPNTVNVQGSSLTPEMRVHIYFGALALLTIQVVSSAAFLLATAVLTSRIKCEVLKSSALATLFALEEDCRGVAGGIESVNGMGRKARVMNVRLRDEAIVLAGEDGRTPVRGSGISVSALGVRKDEKGKEET